MDIGRREFTGALGAVLVAGSAAPVVAEEREGRMYGLIGRMRAQPGQREALIAVLLEGVLSMPGCLSYVVARDPEADDAIWVTEVWSSEAHHKASLSLPSVKEAIAKGRPLIAGMDSGQVTEPVGGHGLVPVPAVPTT